MHSRESRDPMPAVQHASPGHGVSDGELHTDLPCKSDLAASSTVETASDVITNSVGMSLVRIPAGQFTMGLPDAGHRSGRPHRRPFLPRAPPHRVRITRDFYMGAHEVTQQQYEAIAGTNPSAHTPEGQRKKGRYG